MTEQNVSSTDATRNIDGNSPNLTGLDRLDLQDLLIRKTQQLEMLRALRIEAEEILADMGGFADELMDELLADMTEQQWAVQAGLMQVDALVPERQTA